jgi:hypothetical protein
LVFENPPNDLIPVEDQLAARPGPEVRQPGGEMPLPYGPGRTADQFRHPLHVERLTEFENFKVLHYHSPRAVLRVEPRAELP